MSAQPPILPRIAVQSISGGLLLMAFFTLMWAGIADGGLQGAGHHILLFTGAAISLLFIIYAVRLFLAARLFPKFTTAEDMTEGRNMGRSFGIIFGIEGLAIPAACAVLALTHHTDFILPAIALIVGLHFYPMARIFNRTIDYYLATWTCLIALTGIFLTLRHQPPPTVMTSLGIGVALATIFYGAHMIYYAYQMKMLRPGSQPPISPRSE